MLPGAEIHCTLSWGRLNVRVRSLDGRDFILLDGLPAGIDHPFIDALETLKDAGWIALDASAAVRRPQVPRRKGTKGAAAGAQFCEVTFKVQVMQPAFQKTTRANTLGKAMAVVCQTLLAQVGPPHFQAP